MTETKEVSTITKVTKLLLSLAPLVASIAGLIVALNATSGVSENKDNADLSYSTLAERVNRLAEDVSFLKGQMSARSQRRSTPTVIVMSAAATAAIPHDAGTDAEVAYEPLPASLQLLGK